MKYILKNILMSILNSLKDGIKIVIVVGDNNSVQ